MSVAGRITVAAASIMPRLSFRNASRLGRGLGSLAWALDKRHRRVAARNLAVAFPDLPDRQRRRLARGAFQQVGRTVTEMLWSTRLDEKTLPDVVSFEGKEHLDAALAGGRGALLTTAHFGNWELIGVALAHIGVPTSGIGRRVPDPMVEDVLYRLRTRTGAHVLHKDDAVRATLKALRNGEAVGILIDQNTLVPQACFVPFFDRLAATTRITAQLHLRTGAPIIMVFCVPDGPGYRFVIEPLRVELGDVSNEDKVERLTAAATARIESYVREFPQAWLWMHDRWRTRPEEDVG